MYTPHYAPWEHYPKLLRFPEIQNPMSAINDFFDLDSPERHFKALKEWREYIVSESVFEHDRRGPAAVVHYYESNVKLLEASYLLLLDHKNNSFCSEKITEERLSNEKTRWKYLPSVLSVEEQLDPYLPIDALFEGRPLQLYRDFLFEWLFYALSVHSGDQDLSASEVIIIYENLLKLYEAAWLINQRYKDKVKAATAKISVETGMNPADKKKESRALMTEDDSNISLYTLDNSHVEIDKEKLSAITDKIKHKVPLTEVVFYLGTSPYGQQSIFLLVVVSSMEKRRACEVTETIENICKPFADVVALAVEQSLIEQRIADENGFYKQAMACPVIYLSGRLLIPTGNLNAVIRNLNTSDITWARWYGQAEKFFDGAGYYMRSGDYRSALFLLHQAVESALVAIIIAVTGYRPNSHNLPRLLKLTKMFTLCLVAAIEPGGSIPADTNGCIATEKQGSADRELFRLLSDAYVGVRYKDNFEVDDAQVVVIYDLVERVLTITPKVYTKHLTLTSL